MKHAQRYVCTECGHEEFRSLAPLSCPSCDGQFVTNDEEYIEDEMSESDLSELIMREFKAAANG